jgi:ATP-dependent DNA helicase RecG
MNRSSTTPPHQPAAAGGEARLRRLRTILAQERAQGCRDRLVIGGLAGLVANLTGALAQGAPAAAQAHLRRLRALVAGYGALAPAARAERLAAMSEALEGLAAALRAPDATTVAAAVARLETLRELGSEGAGGSGRGGAAGQASRPHPRPQREPGDAAGAGEDATPALAAPGGKTGVPAPPPLRRAARPLDPAEPVTALPFVGEGRARLLARLGVQTVRDLLYHLPARHEDYTRTPPISGLVYGQPQTVVGRFTAVDSSPVKGGRVRVVARLEDHTGAIRCTWFWPAQMAKHKRLPLDELVVVSGRVGQFNGVLAFEQPDYEPADADLLNVGRLVPVYPATEGLYQKQLRAYVRAALAATATTLVDPLPPAVRAEAGLPPLHAALNQAHFPASEADRQAGRQRLALDELLLLQLGMQQRRLAWQASAAPALPLAGRAGEVVERFLAGLPFALTRAQRRTLDQVLADMATARPMSRLVQGDVGSGKTVVAAAAMLVATAHGYQAAIMAPTEILAEQHARTLTRLYAHLPDEARPQVALLKGSLTRKQKAEVYDRVASGALQVVAGTHAVVQTGVTFRNLALAVVDEQHRFGVAQRASLRAKGSHPHLLVMTATPIPRSLALTLHGDLDVSVIDELPPGRQTIETRYATADQRARAYDFIRKEVAAGRQVFIVCPLVEESEAIEARAATAEHERLQREVFPEYRLGLLHGRLSPAEKEAVMRAFRDGELHILVSTAVIEVGIDVPNATVMLIEGADRFGLAQLHQFRGRVGRGAHRSYCLLLSDDASEAASERLRLLAETSDGFTLAEHDLRLRGPGDFLGTRQSGLPPLRVAGLDDLRTIELAQRLAAQVLQRDPALAHPEHQALAERLAAFWADGAGDVS